MSLSQRPVLRHVAPRLSHEPDRGCINWLSPARPQKTRRGHAWSVADGAAEQIAREGDELFEPERFVAQFGSERVDFGCLGFVQIVVACDDCDRGIGESGNCANCAEKLKAIGQGHPQIKDDRVRVMRLGQGQALVGRMRRPYLIPFEAKHPRKCVCHADVVVDNQHASCGRVIAGGHDLLWDAVDLSSRRTQYLVLYFSRFAPLPEVLLSPILLRPVREQLEHDRVIRLLQSKYKRKFEVAINVGNEQGTPVTIGQLPWYADLVLQSAERGRKVLGVVEVETAESVNKVEAMSQWAAFSRLRGAFHLYVPNSMIDVARQLCNDMQILVGEMWAYTAIGDQVRFTLVQRTPRPGEDKTSVTKAPPRRAAAERLRPRPVSAHAPRRAAPSTSARRKASKTAPTRGSARKKTSRPARAQKRK
jgi:hypothetical protein